MHVCVWSGLGVDSISECATVTSHHSWSPLSSTLSLTPHSLLCVHSVSCVTLAINVAVSTYRVCVRDGVRLSSSVSHPPLMHGVGGVAAPLTRMALTG